MLTLKVCATAARSYKSIYFNVMILKPIEDKSKMFLQMGKLSYLKLNSMIV